MNADYALYTLVSPVVTVLSGVIFARADRKDMAETYLTIIAPLVRVLHKSNLERAGKKP